MSAASHAGHDHAHDHGHDHHPTGITRWLYSTNHKDIGTMYLVFAVVASLFGGGFSMMSPPRGESELVRELRKQYDVIEIDPSSPITEEMDVMLAVQPSSLGIQEMQHFVDAVKSGIPTAILEDPLPVMYEAPGTTEPKRPPGGFMGMGQQPQPKGDINLLWDALGVEMVDGGRSIYAGE